MVAQAKKSTKKTTKAASTKKTTAKSTSTKAKTTKASTVDNKKTAPKSKSEKCAKCGAKAWFIGIVVVAVVAIATFIILGLCGLFKNNIAGSYELTGITKDGEDQSSTLSLLKAFGMDATIELREDKTGKFTMYDESADITYDNDNLIKDGEKMKYEYKDGKLSIESEGATLIFEKKKD